MSDYNKSSLNVIRLVTEEHIVGSLETNVKTFSTVVGERSAVHGM
jgi:hypothetical protein